MKRKLLIPLAAALAVATYGACAGPVTTQASPAAKTDVDSANDSASQELKDAYLKGRAVSALLLDAHVSVFDFKVRVEGGVAYVSGVVDQQIERDLAVEIVRGVNGIKEVHSSIEVTPGTRQAREEEEARETLGQKLDDTSTTASVKTKLLANRSTGGLRIHVKTAKGVVILTGKTRSNAEKDLAERIARNTEGVAKVVNRLAVEAPQKTAKK